MVGFELVTAILVVHNGQDWLPATLKSIADLEHRPGRVIVVDAGSTDNSPTLLRQAFNSGIRSRGRLIRPVIDQVIAAQPLGFTRVVNQLVASMPPGDGWLWLLHDDSAPNPECLTELLRVATHPDFTAGPAITIPKLLRPKLRRRPDQVQSVGEAVSIGGARVVGTEVGDIDQQQDESSRALGASTAGLLVRRDAWQALGGLSDQLPNFRAGVDLGWRANEAGLVVRTAPDATLRHQQAGLTGLRGDSSGDPDVEDLAAGVRVAISHSNHPHRAAWWARLANRLVWAGSWVAKDSAQAHLRSAALARFRNDKAETQQLTTAVRRTPARRVPRALLPRPTWALRRSFDAFTRRFIRIDEDGDGEFSIDTLTGDEDEVVVRHRPRRNWAGLGAAIVMVLATLAAARSQIGLTALVSIGLAPAPGSLSLAWHAWLVPSGGQGANAPWLGIMALGSTLMAGQPDWWASVMVLGGVFFAAWSAYRFVARLVAGRVVRFSLALLWAVLLPVTGASADGSPGWVMLGVALPWLAGALVRWADEPVKGLVGLRTPAVVALTLTVAACVTPALWVVGVAAAAVVAYRVQDRRGLIIAALGPLLVLGPWLPRLATQPGRLLTGVDPALSRLPVSPYPPSVLIGQLGLGGPVPLWLAAAVCGVVWTAGLIGLAGVALARWRLWLLGLAAGAAVAAVVASRITLAIDGQSVRAASLPWLLVAGVVAIGAAASTWQSGATPPSRVGEMARRVLAGLIAAAALLGAAWWVWAGAGQPMHREGAVVPDYVQAAESSPRATRTLIVAVSGGQASVSLRDATRPTWGSGETSPMGIDPTDRVAVLTIAGQFADGFASDDLASRMAALGIGHVVVSGVPKTAVDAMAGIPELAGGTVNGVTVWTVGGLPSRVQLLDGPTLTPVTDNTIPAGGDDRQLVLIERADLPWRVSVDGVPLTSVGVSTHFDVPAAGGTLQWWLPVMMWALWWHLAAVLALVWAALPASRAAERAAASEARRVA